MVAGVEPTVVGVAKAIEFADVDHESKVAPAPSGSSISHVTDAFSANPHKSLMTCGAP
jgi:hypothetical protein